MIIAPRSALFLPASNARAIEKARGLACDMVILDLEDAVKDDDKAAARAAAVVAMDAGFDGRIAAIRVNAMDSGFHAADVAAVTGAACDVVVVPKVEDAVAIGALAARLGKPVYAMIETPLGVHHAIDIAAQPGVAGLIAGTNDLANELNLPSDPARTGLVLALQTMVLAARLAGIAALDGVFNRLKDESGLIAECAQGRLFGFDGKTLIHPNQIAPANAGFGPSADEVAEAHALIAAATGGAERFQDRMIESMHVESARRVLARARIA
jgi:citrate lyase subunit beta/citryl-CoA lyase